VGKRGKPRVGTRTDEDDRSLGAALLLTAGSALLPGLAHLSAGRRGTGRTLLTGFALLAGTGLVVAARTGREGALRLVVQPDALVAVMVGAAVLAVAYCAVLVSSYRAVRPAGAGPAGQVAGTAVVGMLCLAVAGSLTYTAHYAHVQNDLIGSVFSDQEPAFVGAGGRENPWAGKPRLNVLLLGGDAGENRTGVRTDSIVLASIDTSSGDTVLLSLPRNLERAPMPPGPARDRFPRGFTGDGGEGANLLNAVWLYGEDHPNLVPGSTAPGPDLLKQTVGTVLGQQVDFYLLVNLDAFQDIVDAFGGVTLRITEPIVYGLENRVLEPGLRRLSGSQALWYSRSRTNTDDYSRMDRQRCMIGAIARQASPQVVLSRFQDIAAATKKAISTDLPASLLPDLLTLAAKAKTARIDSVTFTPPLIKPARADFAEIRQIAAAAVAGQGGQPPAAPPAQTSPSGGNGSDGTPAVRARTSPGAGSTSAVAVEEACRYE
jgi:polyisoprenyl-teichoic acid--peptidoglycan teichoic acid transferase